MKAFVHWVLARRHWLILMAIAFAPLLPILTASLMVLDSTTNGPRRAFTAALYGLAGLWILALLSENSTMIVVALGAVFMLAGVALGGVFRWAGSMNLAFQAGVLGSFATAAAVSVFGPDVSALLGPTQVEFAEMVRANGGTLEQVEAVMALDLELLWGVILAVIFVQLIGALFLGCWWHSLARPDTHFGIQFRTLQLGRVLGIGAMVLVTIGLLVEVPVVRNLLPLALFAFLFQGLAVMHAWAHAKRVHPGYVACIYVLSTVPLVLLISPLAVLPITVLSVVGLLDNVFALRSPLRG